MRTVTIHGEPIAEAAFPVGTIAGIDNDDWASINAALGLYVEKMNEAADLADTDKARNGAAGALLRECATKAAAVRERVAIRTEIETGG